MASKYRKLDPRTWGDEKFIQLSPEEKLVFLYCISGPQVNRCGVYALSTAMAAEKIGMPLKTFLKHFQKVATVFGWGWDESVRILYLPTWWKYNPPENQNVLRGNLSDLDDLPQTNLIREFASNLRYLPATLHETFAKRLPKPSPNTLETFAKRLPKPSPNQEQEQEQEQEQDKAAAGSGGGNFETFGKEFLKAWNALGPPFKPIASMTEKRIEALASRAADAFWRDNWRRALEAVPHQKFLRGEGERGWVATADFFLEPDTVAAILEGKYQDVHKPKPTTGRPGGIASGRVSAPLGAYANAGRNSPADETSGSGEQTPADPFEGLG